MHDLKMKKRFRENDDDSCCSMKMLTLLILLTMLVQLVVMSIPVATGYSIYYNNKEAFDALGNMSTPAIVNNINHVKDLPIMESKFTMHNAKLASDKLLGLLKRVQNITGEVDTNADIFKDVRTVLHKTVAPLDRVKDFLNPRMRGTVMKIIEKILRILDTMSDAEIHQLVLSINKAVVTADRAMSITNVNKTMHVMDDADKALNKFDSVLSKFVN